MSLNTSGGFGFPLSTVIIAILAVIALIAVIIIAASVSNKRKELMRASSVIRTASEASPEPTVTSAFSKAEKADESELGEGWSYSKGFLTVSLSGRMPDYEERAEGSSAPWSKYRNEAVDVKFSGAITYVGKNAFRDFTQIVDLELPEGVTEIGSYAFQGCTKLEYVRLPKSFETVGASAFYCCTALCCVDFNGIKNVGNQAFYYCEELEKTLKSDFLIVPPTVESIGNEAFYGCSRLGKVEIRRAQGSVKIGTDAFPPDCEIAYVAVKAPEPQPKPQPKPAPQVRPTPAPTSAAPAAAVTASAAPKAATAAPFPGDLNPVPHSALTWSFADGTLTVSGSGKMPDYYDVSEDSPLVTPWEEHIDSITKVIVKYGVTSIGACTFCGLKKLTSVIIADTVTSIGTLAFSNCEALPAVEIPASVRYVGDYSFAGCKALSSLNIANGVEVIDTHAFSSCSALKFVKLPASTHIIGDCAFINCDDLATVTVDCYRYGVAVSDTSFNSGCAVRFLQGVIFNPAEDKLSWNFNNGTLTITGTGNMIDYYDRADDKSADTPWEKHLDEITKVVIGPGVTSVGSGTFASCENLREVRLSETVRSIGELAFANCKSLERVYSPSGVLEIGEYAFSGCEKLAEAPVSDRLKVIGCNAFAMCDNIRALFLPITVVRVGCDAFACCWGLKKVTVDSSRDSISIHDSAFPEGCETVYTK